MTCGDCGHRHVYRDGPCWAVDPAARYPNAFCDCGTRSSDE